jgi:hypothetical protein
MMDDELCDTVVMGAVHLQAAFSVVNPGAPPSKMQNATPAHLSTGCTRGYDRLLHVLPCLRVLRCTTLAVLALNSDTIHSMPSCFDAL